MKSKTTAMDPSLCYTSCTHEVGGENLGSNGLSTGFAITYIIVLHELEYYKMLLLFYILDNNKIVSAVIVETFTHTKIVQKSSNGTKAEIVTNLLKPRLYKDKTN